MKYESNFDTEVQKVELFTFLPTIILPAEKRSVDRKPRLNEKNRSTIQNKKEVLHKLIKYFKNT
ncbi:MAG: hypothetical protein CVU41_06085 [Chloroflexi bacterium HGW-Chloroflexi-3]|nr:MAG: hypothetical protein CVU41_06085 [Chloroflexi bacterium HGW-Chloroflexi-3]